MIGRIFARTAKTWCGGIDLKHSRANLLPLVREFTPLNVHKHLISAHTVFTPLQA